MYTIVYPNYDIRMLVHALSRIYYVCMEKKILNSY